MRKTFAGRNKGTGLDIAQLAEGLSRPGMDPREWGSYATVDADPVEFDPDYGVLVSLTCQPSKVQIRARVGMSIAGNGEGEYYPFVEGDEVYVLFPQGNPRGDAIIVARCANQRTPFPQGSVAGQDPAGNAFAFKRMRTAFIQETSGPMLFRQAGSESFLSLDTNGTVTIKDGQGSALQMSPDLYGFQSGDAKFLLQLDLSAGRFTLQVNDALLTLSSSAASPEVNSLSVPGLLTIGTSANPPAEHAISTEATANLIAAIANVLGQILISLFPGPLTGVTFGGLLVDPVFSTTVLVPAVTAAAAGVPPFNPALAAAIQAAFSTAVQKPPGIPGQGQLRPGIGCAGLVVG